MFPSSCFGLITGCRRQGKVLSQGNTTKLPPSFSSAPFSIFVDETFIFSICPDSYTASQLPQSYSICPEANNAFSLSMILVLYEVIWTRINVKDIMGADRARLQDELCEPDSSSTTFDVEKRLSGNNHGILFLRSLQD